MRKDRIMKKTDSKKNVMLLCLSTLNIRFNLSKYTYHFRGEDWPLEGYLTNEAPVKSVIQKLNQNHGQRLDRIVEICSKDVQKNIQEGKLSDDLEQDYGQKIFEKSHKTFFEEAIQNFAEKENACYKKENIEFCPIEIASFSNEEKIAQAVINAANEVMKDYEDIDLYIDFNGGPRNVAALFLGVTNLMKLRNVKIREIIFMEHKQDGKSPVKNMDAIFGCVDLAAGLNEYINYGRVCMLTEYFRKCENPNIQRILQTLGDFSNNMQLCLTGYVLENKEKIKRELEEYLANKEEKRGVYEKLFSFVAEDILRGCRQLLEGDLPEMILWCLDKEFIHQALIFYTERMPAYFWDSGIFCPSMEERQAYACWQIDCELDDREKGKENPYRFMNEKYCWMVHYLTEIEPVICEENLTSLSAADRENPENYEICGIIGTRIEAAQEQAGKVLKALCPKAGRACSIVPKENYKELEQAMVEYFLIQSQCMGSDRRIAELADEGKLWSYPEMYRALKTAADRLCRIRQKH